MRSPLSFQLACLFEKHEEEDLQSGASRTKRSDTRSMPTFCWWRVDIVRATNDVVSQMLAMMMTQQNF